jgi:hypothetical protein
MTDQILRSTQHIPPLRSEFERADDEAAAFFVLWNNNADANTLITALRRMSRLALEIVEAEWEERDNQADRTKS